MKKQYPRKTIPNTFSIHQLFKHSTNLDTFSNKIKLPLYQIYFRMRVQLSKSEEGLLISKLFIQNISMADNGTYLCIAMNKFGSSNSEFVLHVTNNVKECFKLIINLHNNSSFEHKFM